MIENYELPFTFESSKELKAEEVAYYGVEFVKDFGTFKVGEIYYNVMINYNKGKMTAFNVHDVPIKHIQFSKVKGLNPL